MTGKMTINDAPLKASKMKMISNIVPQDDVLIPVLTAFQALMYAADLRLSGTYEEKKTIVDRLLKLLSIEVCRDEMC